MATNSVLVCVKFTRTCCLPVLLRANEALWPRQSDVTSLNNNCINTAVDKSFGAVASSNTDFICFTTGFRDIHSVLVKKKMQILKQNCSFQYSVGF